MDNFNLGKYLRSIREEKQLTTRDMAKKSGFSYSYIAGVEKGHKANPSVSFLENYIYGLSEDKREISSIKENISKGTGGKYFSNFLNIKHSSIEEVNKDKSLIKAFLGTNSPNLMFREDEGIISDEFFNFPINDIGFHLNDKYNSKYFRKLKLTDDDRKYIYKLINDYLIRKVQLQKREVEHQLELDSIDSEVANRYIEEYQELIKRLNDPNDFKY